MEEFSHFQLFDEAHLITLTFIVLLSILSAFFGFWIREVKAQKFISWSFVLIFIVSEVYSNFTALQSGHWRYTWALPLQLCDLSLLALMVALLWKNQTAWELAYYWGIGGSIPAMITPDLPMAFPHFFYLTFFFSACRSRYGCFISDFFWKILSSIFFNKESLDNLAFIPSFYSDF